MLIKTLKGRLKSGFLCQPNKGFTMRFLLLITTLFLTACNSTQGVSVYSFTNAEVESVLAKELPKLSEKVKLMGLPVQLLSLIHI